MKNIFKFVVLASLMLPLSSCMFEQEDFFDESSSIRMQNAKDDIKNILCEQSADGKYGWVFQYFVAGTDETKFEGFTLFAKFHQDGQVTLASNHRYLRNGKAGTMTEHSSLYQMISEEGPILSFSTWNDVLTVFSDPVDPAQAPKSIVQDGQGMLGDYNLVVTSFSKDEIILRGERYTAISRLVPCTCPWEEYLASVDKIQSSFNNDKTNALLLSNGVDSAYVLDLQTGCFTANDRVDDPVRSETLSCVYTPDGFRLGKMSAWGGMNFQTFVYDTENMRFVCKEDEKITIASLYKSALDFFLRSTTTGVKWKVNMDPESTSADAIKNLEKNFLSGTKNTFKNLSIQVTDAIATVSIGYSRSKKNNTEYYDFQFKYEQTGNSIKLSDPVGVATADKTAASKGGVKELLEFLTDEFVVSDDVPSVTRNKITFSKASDSSVYFHMIY